MLGDFTWKIIEKDMSCLSQRLKATSRNIANADTPGYARRNVSFEDQLREVIGANKKLRLAVTEPGHIPTRPSSVADVHPLEIKVSDEPYRLDGNNVDPEREMAILSETRMMYTAMGRLAARKLATYRTAIAGR